MKVPYALPFIGEEERQQLLSVLESKWLSRGPKTLEFEKQFSQLVNSPHSIGVNSCTAGLHLAQLALGIGPGDEVITTPYTFIASVNTIIHCGAKPVLVDIDPRTLNIDVDRIEQAITPRTKAIIPVHFAGYPCEMSAIMDFAKRHRLSVIEDAAHAVYTKYGEHLIGSIGDVTCFSFYATKNLSTGEGGMVTTANGELAEKMRVMSLHGMSKNAWNRYSDGGSWYYEVDFAGFKYNMTDIQASLGLAQLEKLEYMQRLRAQYAKMYSTAFSQCDELILPVDSDEHRHGWHLYVLRINEKATRLTREILIDQLKEAGIGTSVHFIPVPLHPLYLRLGYRPEDYPKAVNAFESAVSLPLYPGLSVEQVTYVIHHVKTILSRFKR